MRRRRCTDCAHFHREGGTEWGWCKATLPVWISAPPLLISDPDAPELAPNCNSFCKVLKMPAKLTEEVVDRLLRARRFRGRTAEAIKLVLLHDQTRAEASRTVGVSGAAVSRMMKKLESISICPACGQHYHPLISPVV